MSYCLSVSPSCRQLIRSSRLCCLSTPTTNMDQIYTLYEDITKLNISNKHRDHQIQHTKNQILHQILIYNVGDS